MKKICVFVLMMIIMFAFVQNVMAVSVPILDIEDAVTTGSEANVSISYNAYGNDIDSIVAAVVYDDTYLDVIDVTFDVPAGYSTYWWKVGSQINIVTFYFGYPKVFLESSDIVTIHFSVGNQFRYSALEFSNDPPVSFGGDGISIPGMSANGSLSKLSFQDTRKDKLMPLPIPVNKVK